MIILLFTPKKRSAVVFSKRERSKVVELEITRRYTALFALDLLARRSLPHSVARKLIRWFRMKYAFAWLA